MCRVDFGYRSRITTQEASWDIRREGGKEVGEER